MLAPTQNYCQALVQPRRMAPPRVTLQQCGNAAYGVCQSTANTASMSPCGNAFNGISKCSKSEFEKFYNGEPIIYCCRVLSVRVLAQKQQGWYHSQLQRQGLYRHRQHSPENPVLVQTPSRHASHRCARL